MPFCEPLPTQQKPAAKDPSPPQRAIPYQTASTFVRVGDIVLERVWDGREPLHEYQQRVNDEARKAGLL